MVWWCTTLVLNLFIVIGYQLPLAIYLLLNCIQSIFEWKKLIMNTFNVQNKCDFNMNDEW